MVAIEIDGHALAEQITRLRAELEAAEFDRTALRAEREELVAALKRLAAVCDWAPTLSGPLGTARALLAKLGEGGR